MTNIAFFTTPMIDKCSQQELVSVVMPTYNQARYIGESIESVLKQTYHCLELIIIDNYSEDGTEKIVMGYVQRDKRIKYLKFRNNGIIANSRNLGIELANGSFIAFIDSDDLWHEDKLKQQMPLFERPEVGFVYCLARQIDADGNDINVYPSTLNFRGRVLEHLLSQKLSLTNSSIVVKKSLLNDHGICLRTDRQCAEDWDLWLRVSELADIDYTERILVSYRIHSSSASRDHDIIYKSEMTTLDDFERHLVENYSTDRSQCDKLLKACKISRAACMDFHANYSLGKRRYRNALQMTKGVISLRPSSSQGWKLLAKVIVYPMWRYIRSVR